MTELNEISGRIIGAAIRVHKAYGPGLLESVYKASLVQELLAAGFEIEAEKRVSLKHDGVPVRAYVLDLLVEGKVIVEVKCVAQITPVHRAQLLTYLKLTGLQLGLILNFNVPRLIDGIKRVVNNYRENENAQTGSGT